MPYDPFHDSKVWSIPYPPLRRKGPMSRWMLRFRAILQATHDTTSSHPDKDSAVVQSRLHEVLRERLTIYRPYEVPHAYRDFVRLHCPY